MVSTELLIYSFFGLIFLLAISFWLYARSIDPPLKNEEYLAEHLELRELKQKAEKQNKGDKE